ncbi:NADP-dependent oxidoreductase domain containing protein [Amanita muscaria]
MYASFYGLRQLFRSPYGNRFLHWKGCHHRNSSTAIELPTHYVLPSGDKIPSIALGVWRAAPNQVSDAVKTALKKGYRHIDGAWIYGNEAEVGRAISESNIARSEIWLTSKLWNTFHIPDDIEPTLDESLANLGTDYIDLYLIHWPVAFDKNSNVDFDLTEDPYPTWQKLEELVEKGKIRNIGPSWTISTSFVVRLNNLTANPLKIKPAVNQVELNFWLPQPDLLKWSKENNVILEAYSPLGSAERVRDSLSVPEIQEVAAELGLTPAQVLISWHIQRGAVVLPKAVKPSHVEENFKVAALPQAAFEKVEKAATSHEPQRGLDPSKGWGIDIFE